MSNEKGVAVNFYYRFYQLVADGPNPKETAISCAIASVNEIIFEKRQCYKSECSGKTLGFWKKVKEELKCINF